MSGSTRERVLLFEKELQQNVERAVRIEKQILNLTEARREYISSITSSGRHYETTNQRVKLSSLETSVIALDFLLKEYEFKEVKGTQELVLIELSTRPLDVNETNEQRNQSIAQAHINHQDSTCEWLVDAISLCMKDKSKLRSILTEAKHFESEVQASIDDIINTTLSQLEEFITNMKIYISQSEIVRKKVTGDYLVLRHNARVAEKVLCERRQAAVIAREDMQANLDALLREASLRRSNVEESLRSEQARLLQEARENVMQRENEVDLLAAVVKGSAKKAKKTVSRLKSSIKQYEVMYTKLAKRREKDVKTINAELKKFRDMIAAVELSIGK
jgi:hypothetical protein